MRRSGHLPGLACVRLRHGRHYFRRRRLCDSLKNLLDARPVGPCGPFGRVPFMRTSQTRLLGYAPLRLVLCTPANGAMRLPGRLVCSATLRFAWCYAHLQTAPCADRADSFARFVSLPWRARLRFAPPNGMATYRAEVVGSLLRPAYLKQARLDLAADRLSIRQFKQIEDQAVDEAIALQQESGVDVVTDGEMRRSGFVGPLNDY